MEYFEHVKHKVMESDVILSYIPHFEPDMSISCEWTSAFFKSCRRLLRTTLGSRKASAIHQSMQIRRGLAQSVIPSYLTVVDGRNAAPPGMC